MKRKLKKFLLTLLVCISFFGTLCYADEIDPIVVENLKNRIAAGEQTEPTNYISMIIIGILVVIVVVEAIIILMKSQKPKDEEEKNEK